MHLTGAPRIRVEIRNLDPYTFVPDMTFHRSDLMTDIRAEKDDFSITFFGFTITEPPPAIVFDQFSDDDTPPVVLTQSNTYQVPSQTCDFGAATPGTVTFDQPDQPGVPALSILTKKWWVELVNGGVNVNS